MQRIENEKIPLDSGPLVVRSYLSKYSSRLYCYLTVEQSDNTTPKLKFNFMTLIHENNLKVVLYEQGQDEFWSIVLEHYNNGDFKIWKRLAILSLRENAGWSMEMIGLVFGHSRGHISRILSELKKELRSQFEDSPEWIYVKTYTGDV